MKTLPTTDLRYWLTIVAACTMGETAGDFFSHGLKLGYGVASIGLILLFVLVMAVELRAKLPNEARYWTAIIITSTTGTTMADFVTRSLGLGYVKGTAALLVLLALVFVVGSRLVADPRLPHVEIDRPSSPDSALPHVEIKDPKKGLPNTDARYWAAILVVSTIGTTLGDSVSDGLDQGTRRATAMLAVLLVVVLFVELRAKVRNEARYWTAVILTSTIGATSGDFLTKEDGLNLGVFKGSAILIVLFLAIVLVGRQLKPATAKS